MANKKISELDAAPNIDGNEAFPVVKNGLNYKATIAMIKAWIGSATSTVAGLMSNSDKAKLDGIAANATANASDAQLRARSSHTGTQAASTIEGLHKVATSGAYSDLGGKPDLSLAGIGAAPADHVGMAGTGAHPVATSSQPGFMPAAHFTAVANLKEVAVTGKFADMEDVDLTGLQVGQVAKWNGTKWVPTDMEGGGGGNSGPVNYYAVVLQNEVHLTGTGRAGAVAITSSLVRVGQATAGTADALILPSVDGAGVALPTGTRITVLNHTGEDIKIWPPADWQFGYNGVNSPKTVGSYGIFECFIEDATAKRYRDY